MSMEEIQTLYDLECTFTGAIRNLWDKYCGYIFLFAIVVVLVCYQCPMLYEPWICKGWSYTPNSSLVDEQIDLIKIQEIIKKGGIAKRHEASPEDEFEYNWLEAKKEQMESRRQVMRELRDGFSIETFQLRMIK